MTRASIGAVRHLLVDIVVIAIVAVVRGAQGWDDLVDFVQLQEAWLRTFLELPNGAACADTFRRVLWALGPHQLRQCFGEDEPRSQT